MSDLTDKEKEQVEKMLASITEHDDSGNPAPIQFHEAEDTPARVLRALYDRLLAQRRNDDLVGPTLSVHRHHRY
jgi:hypothetical protein